ncbi:leucine-rich repeat domain-containing protein [Streptomyces pseudovenezuelae]|uniref:non-specific serine/threonine protein kinase n=1 Tax=Streptomyces pseudovenezuelae TaxID=67350 RepID=A0ABZ1WY70_9ACTN|nr:leucine-rich repeat domain-containing protein [Streptomyces pseudovenezuelae]
MGHQELREAEQRIEEVRLSESERLTLRGISLSHADLAILVPKIAQVDALTVLDLRGTGAEALPESVGQLTNLTTLNLSGTNLTELPESVGQLTNLTTLNLSGTNLTELPESVGQLTNLTTLNLSGTNLTELPESVGQLTNLTTLNLGSNALTELPDWIGQLTNLTNLNLIGTNLTELPDWIGQLTNLTNLNLIGTSLTDVPDWIGQLTNLTRLNLSGSNLTELPESIRRLTNLSILDLSFTRVAVLPESIRALASLTRLNLSGTRLKNIPEWIGQLTNLTHLQLAFITPLESFPEEIGQLTNLTNLHLGGTRSMSSLEWIGQLSNLTTLDLSFTGLTAVPESIRTLTNLSRLDLSYNSLPMLPEWVGQLTSLTTLSLGNNDLKVLPGWIGQLTNLTSISLTSANVTELPESLGSLTNLTSLELNIRRLTAVPEWIKQLRKLEALSISTQHLEVLPEWIAELDNLKTLSLNIDGLNSLPEWISQLKNLESLTLIGADIASIPNWIGQLTNLTTLNLAINQLEDLPDEVGRLSDLKTLDLTGNNFTRLPSAIRNLTRLTSLELEDNNLTQVPGWLGELNRLTSLKLGRNENVATLPDGFGKLVNLTSLDLTESHLTTLPDCLKNLTNLKSLELSGSKIQELPSWLGELANLEQLDLMVCQLHELPNEIGDLRHLKHLDLDGNKLCELPDSLGNLTELTSLDLRKNRITDLPDTLTDLKKLQNLYIQENQLAEISPSLGELNNLSTLAIHGNPLPPEVLAAEEEGTDELLNFLRLLHSEGELIHEAKLVLVGEGAVGKSTLLAALRGEAWVEDRDTTHGIEIRPVEVTHNGAQITLNSWDFGGQKIYRPTHQLFFTDPAVYLVVWKPREGPELGLVDEWISLIRHRAGAGAKVHVVATHGGPGQRYAHIDEAALRERYGDMIVAFHHVDSKSSPNGGISDLKSAIAATAAGLPHVTRWYPSNWRRLRESLKSSPNAYLRFDAYQEIAAQHGLSPTSARSLARNAHALGQWIHYADDQSLAELIILKADWLSVAIGLVLEDATTIAGEGLLPHRRLGEIWDDPHRDAGHRYPHPLQQVFLRLMERFEISYRVPELTGGEPLSLIAQLLPTERPNLAADWETYRPHDPELVHICNIQEKESRRAVQPYGLMYRLIVLFHRHSLGRGDVTKALHWASGMVLQDRYGARALVVLSHEGLTIRVRGLNPQAFLDHLVQEVREYVEGFWKGLSTRVLVPCKAICQFGDSGHGLFDLDKLYRRLEAGKHEYTCPDPSCDEDVAVEALLRGLDRRGVRETQIENVVREAVSEVLDSHVSRLLAAHDAGTRQVLARIDDLDDATKEAFSRAEDQLAGHLRSLDDDAADGPRLFSLDFLDRSLLRPGLTTQRMKLTLWCEHSRLPVHVLEPDKPEAGVYIIEVPREWWVKAAPAVRATSALLKTILPVSLAAIEFDLSDQQWDAVKEQLALSKELLGASAETAQMLSEAPSGDNLTVSPNTGATPTRAEGGLLRMLHASLREQDITFADLRRVRDSQGRFLWVHQRFVPEYQPPLPVIPPVS